MAEALADDARFGARLQRQRFADADLLVARCLRFAHSIPFPIPFGFLAGRAAPTPALPFRRCESASCADSARGNPGSLGRQAGQHVSHLTGPMPNPIARRKTPGSQGFRGFALVVAAQQRLQSCGSRPSSRRRHAASAATRIVRRSRPRPWKIRSPPRPALPAIDKASSAARSSRRSVIVGQIRASPHLALEALGEQFCAAPPGRPPERVAVTHKPRPGRLRLMSGTTAPSGADDEADQLLDRLDLARDDAKSLRRAPFRRAAIERRLSSSAASMPGVAHLTLPRLLRPASSAGFDQIGFRDPAGLQARLHDDRLAFLARQFEAVEDAGLALGFAILALGPADEIVGGAAGQVLDRLDAVLAEARPASAW